MFLIMTINQEPFIGVDFDFIGKETDKARELHLKEIAGILEDEYAAEIVERGGEVTFHYMQMSSMDKLEVTDFDMLQFDIKLKATRFMKYGDKDRLQEQDPNFKPLKAV